MRRCLSIAVVAGCAIGQRPLIVPPNDEATVMLVTGAPHPWEGVAQHPWFSVRAAHATRWRIYEVRGDTTPWDQPFEHGPYTTPIVQGIWRGAEAVRASACLEKYADAWMASLDYRAWPGPNSNTFADVMLRQCGLHASLPATSIGKDWRGWFGASRTTEGTGVQVETPLVGLRVGLKEGVQVHLLGLSFGFDLWPPAIILPVGSGRLGFADR
ncbi:MAG: hypothetical protein JWO36_1672 [Myxococcales bacterium]|nr:hypothetical protein [Myxococcales bacterium]